jgi:hypothetical protein
VKRLLEFVPEGVPFPRGVIETIVGGDDPLRATRADARQSRGGAHPLGDFRVLSYETPRSVMEELGLPALATGEHMKVAAADLRRVGVE